MAEGNDSQRQDFQHEPGPRELRAILSLAARQDPAAPVAAEDQALARAAERQRHVKLALERGGPAAPPALRARLEQLEDGSRRWRRSRRRAGLNGPAQWAGAFGACAATVAAVILATGVMAGPERLTATRVADVWTLPASTKIVRTSSTNRGELAVAFHGTAFPAYRDREGWHAVGSRRDTIDGTPTLTVFYATGARRAAYTVVAGREVAIPPGAERFVSRGVQLAEFRGESRWVIVFRNHGNTCVLTAAAPREKAWLVKLAVWSRASGSPVA